MGKPGANLYVGVGGHVVAVDISSGTELWRRKLKGSNFTTVFESAGRVFAGAGGELFCLDAATGEILWRNRLKGLGIGLVSFPGSDASAAVAAQIQAASAAAAT